MFLPSIEVQGNKRFNCGGHAQLAQGAKNPTLEEAYAEALKLLDGYGEISGAFACVLTDNGAARRGFNVERIRGDLFRLTPNEKLTGQGGAHGA